MLQLNIK